MELGCKVVLCVAERGTITAAYMRQLKSQGHIVFCVDTAADALRFLRYIRIDLIVVDRLTAGTTRLRVAAEIRSYWPRFPVMMLLSLAERRRDLARVNAFLTEKEAGQEGSDIAQTQSAA